jgi:hypothetical protein
MGIVMDMATTSLKSDSGLASVTVPDQSIWIPILSAIPAPYAASAAVK